MKKLMNSALALCLTLAISSTSLFSKDARNKTFLMPRSHGVNLALEHSSGWTELLMRNHHNRFGGNIQAVGYYMKGDESELADYFTCSNKAASCDPQCPPKKNEPKCLTFGVAALDGNTGKPAKADIEKYDLDKNCFCHSGTENGFVGTPTAGTDSRQVAKLQFDIEHEAYGVHFVYHQNLDMLYKGLFLRVLLPIAHVENNVKACWSGECSTDLENYFSGNKCTTNRTNAEDEVISVAQDKLKFLNFGGKDCGDRTSTGVADIDFLLGYRVYEGKRFWASLNFGLTVPTGDEAKSNDLFEAVVGNGGHFAIGLGAEMGLKIWGDHCHNLKFHAAMNYRYLMESAERRTLGIQDPTDVTESEICDDPCRVARCWGHYKLLANCEKNSLVPAANKLTQEVDITPGSQIDSIVALWYNNGGLSVNIGYNLYWKEAEDVKLKKCEIFKKNCWGFPRQDFDFARSNNGGTAVEVGVTNDNKFGSNSQDFECGTANSSSSYISDKNIITETAETPEQISHKIYAGIAYTWTEWEVPFFVGFGGHYEFASNNSVVENYGVHGKVGISF